MINKLSRSALTAVIALPMMFVTQGCTDQDVAVGLGAVAIVAGAAAIGSAVDNNHHRDHRRWERERWERDHRGPRRGPPRGRHWNTTLAVEGLSVDPAAQRVAQKYGIGMKSAEVLTTALQAANDGDLQPIRALGLADNDFQRLAKLQMVSNAGLHNLAAKLEMSDARTQTLIQDIINDFKVQAKDSSSEYWQSCFEAGSWKTPENLSCEKSFWPGCSPETGASLCVVSK